MDILKSQHAFKPYLGLLYSTKQEIKDIYIIDWRKLEIFVRLKPLEIVTWIQIKIWFIWCYIKVFVFATVLSLIKFKSRMKMKAKFLKEVTEKCFNWKGGH